MARCLIKSVNPEAIQLENIFRVMADEYFCKDKASKIVGGPKKLEELISSGFIRAEKPTQKQNGKWFCNAADVLRHCRNMRNKN